MTQPESGFSLPKLRHDFMTHVLSLKLSLKNFKTGLSNTEELIEELEILLTNMEKSIEKLAKSNINT